MRVVLSRFSPLWLCVTPWTVAHQAPLSMGFSRQEYWSRLPYPPPGDFPAPGIEPGSPALQADSFPLSHCRSVRTAFIVDPDSMTRALTREENRDTNKQENIMWKKEAEFGVMCLPVRSCPGLLVSTELGRGKKEASPETSEIVWLCYILISDFQPPELWEEAFLLFQTTQSVVPCYVSSRKLSME